MHEELRDTLTANLKKNLDEVDEHKCMVNINKCFICKAYIDIINIYFLGSAKMCRKILYQIRKNSISPTAVNDF